MFLNKLKSMCVRILSIYFRTAGPVLIKFSGNLRISPASGSVLSCSKLIGSTDVFVFFLAIDH